MKGLNTIPENGKQIETIGLEMKPDFGPATLNIKVSHGVNDHEVTVPSNSSFGDLKSVIVQKIGLNPETHKLLFRGKEKEDAEDLHTAGVKDNSKVLIMEDITSGQKDTEEVKETNVISQGGEAVAEIRKEVDKLADQVSAVQAVVDSGTKVDNKDIVYLTEMLMRQLLKLDEIKAEGEGKVQRKMEVRRVQSLVDTMDVIKSRNSNPFINGNKTASVTTQWETFEPGFGSATAPSPVPFTPIPTLLSSPPPSPSPALLSSPPPAPALSSSPAPAPALMSSPPPAPALLLSPTVTPLSSPARNPNPSITATPSPSHSPSLTSTPITTPVSSFAASPVPSSTKTEVWEHFD